MGKLSCLMLCALLISSCGEDDGVDQSVGVQLYSFRNQFKEDAPSMFQQLKAWGITSIEGGVDTYGLSQEEFVRLLIENNLQVVSADASFEEIRDNPERVAKRAKSFGASYVMCAWIPHDGDDYTLEDNQNATQVFNSAGKFFRSQGLNLVYHPHGYEFRPYGEGTLFDDMAKKAVHFDFEMDVYWVVHGGEDPMLLFDRYPDKFKLMHLKDMKKGTVGNLTGHGDVEDNVTLGTGMIDIKALALRGKELGVTHFFLEDESSRSVEQVGKSLEFIKKEVF